MGLLKLLYQSRQALMHWKEFRLLFATTAAMMLTTLFAAVSSLLIIFEITVIFLTILRSTISRKKQDSTHLYPKSNL